MKMSEITAPILNVEFAQRWALTAEAKRPDLILKTLGLNTPDRTEERNKRLTDWTERQLARAIPAYNWVITQDHEDGQEAGTVGPRGAYMTADQIKKAGDMFTLWDDDDNKYYTGYIARQFEAPEGDFDIAEEGFEPLDDFGTPNAGCVYIKYRDASGCMAIL